VAIGSCKALRNLEGFIIKQGQKSKIGAEIALEQIYSRENQLIKDIRKLKDRKYRNDKGEFVVEGFRSCIEALESYFEVPFVFLSDNSIEKWKEFSMENRIQKNSKVYMVSESIFKTLCSTETPQGIAAVVKRKEINLEKERGFYVLADKVQDPGNMGTIIRSAHAAGALGIIVTKGTVDVYNDKTIRSTMGSIFHIPVIEDLDLKNVKELKEKGFQLLVSSLDTHYNFYDVNMKGNMIIAVGNEGNGISDEVMNIADIKVKIPMPGGAESLNAAVAASIMIFEGVRQRNAEK
jgi:RNA methyltransferase, TrmH family